MNHQLAELIGRWARLAFSEEVLVWDAVSRMIEAAEQVGRILEGRVTQLAQQYQTLVGGPCPTSMRLGC